MNRRIKQVWLLAILSSFLLIGLQTYWLYNSVTYSMGEMGKKNAEKAEQAIVTYQTNIGAAVKKKSHIGYVVTAYFSDFKSPFTTVCSPLDTDTIIGGVVCRKPGFGNVMEKRDTFDLRETDSNNSFDCLNTYITYQLTRFDKAHFDSFISRKLGNDFIGAEMKTGKHRLWQTRIVEPPTLFHHEMLVEVPFNPIQYQSMQMRMQVLMLPILKGMMWQMIGSLLVTIMLLLSIAYLIKVMLLQKKVDKMRSDFVHTMIHELKRPVQTLKMCVSVFSAQKTDEKDENALIMETVREESDNLTAYLAKLREVIRAEEQIPLQITSFDIHAALLNLVAVYRKNKQKKVDKMRSDFVHTMIHELKRPVQTLKMCVSVFSAQKTDEKDENALIMETVREESDNLTAYLAKLREVIRAEEHIPLQITSFDIHAALQNLVAFYRKNRQKEVNVSLDYLRTSDRMMGDRDQLLNVVSNLMENSVKYSGDIVNIHVACRDTEKEEVMISVSDNGIGISPDEQQRVWTKFYRSNAYPDMMQPGIGLGLSFVDMIVKAHGGRKMMLSEVGKGTRISIVIPQHS